jgi:hypothetical protein
MAGNNDYPILYTLFGFNRAGRILYLSLFVLAIPALVVWTVVLPRARFQEQEERLFHGARHGDVAEIERALADGAHVDRASPIDGKTALFRAAVFGRVDAVRSLLAHGADPNARGNDGRTALEVIRDARQEEKDAARQRALDAVEGLLSHAEPLR